jgi:hypothetical protein
MKKVIMTDEEQQFSDLKQLFNKIVTKKKILIGPPASTPKTPTTRRVASAKLTPRQLKMERQTHLSRSDKRLLKIAPGATMKRLFWSV